MSNFITKLFGGLPNPTADWPLNRKLDLAYDLRSCSINGLKLDGALEQAQVFGRCDEFKRDDEYLDLVYRRLGLARD